MASPSAEPTSRPSRTRRGADRRAIARRAGRAILVLLAGTSAARADDQVARMTREARVAATGGWHADARLVDVQVSGYGYVQDPAHPTTLRSDHTPKVLLLYFYAPSAPDDLLRAFAQFNFTPDQQELVRQHPEVAGMRWQEMPGGRGMAPYTLPVPDNVTEVTDAVALAERGGLDQDCADTNYGCGNVFDADLHVYLVANGRGVPIWRIGFGQAATGEEVVRLVDAGTGRLVTNCSVPGGGAAPGSPGTLQLNCR